MKIFCQRIIPDKKSNTMSAIITKEKNWDNKYIDDTSDGFQVSIAVAKPCKEKFIFATDFDEMIMAIED